MDPQGRCAAKSAGLRIGDQIVAANDHFVGTVTALQKAVVAARQTPPQPTMMTGGSTIVTQGGGGREEGGVGEEGVKRVVRLLVLRWADPRSMVKVSYLTSHHITANPLLHLQSLS